MKSIVKNNYWNLFIVSEYNKKKLGKTGFSEFKTAVVQKIYNPTVGKRG